jgi:hypothetical protein
MPDAESRRSRGRAWKWHLAEDIQGSEDACSMIRIYEGIRGDVLGDERGMKLVVDIGSGRERRMLIFGWAVASSGLGSSDWLAYERH